MTLEQLLNCSSSQLISLSDEELEKVLSPYYRVTRPPPKDYSGDNQLGFNITQSITRRSPTTTPKKVHKQIPAAALAILKKIGAA